MIYTTLNHTRKHNPCTNGWRKLLTYLGKTEADDAPLAYSTIIESNGLDDALWCLRAEPQHSSIWRMFAVRCARRVQHLMTDERALQALDVAERHARGAATDSELTAARVATWYAARATAWAATGKNIPCGLTMMGDEFGGPVPVGPFRLIGSEAIGEGVVETLRKYPHSPAVLMQNHGPFTIGRDAEAAVKAAAMTEEVAHTMWAAKQLGDIIEIPQEDVDKLNDRYQNVYGQH